MWGKCNCADKCEATSLSCYHSGLSGPFWPDLSCVSKCRYAYSREWLFIYKVRLRHMYNIPTCFLVRRYVLFFLSLLWKNVEIKFHFSVLLSQNFPCSRYTAVMSMQLISKNRFLIYFFIWNFSVSPEQLNCQLLRGQQDADLLHFFTS